ncbi:MAG: KilA-N domain-containing protein [Bacteroidales bacterium]
MSKINTIDIKNAIISITKIEEEDYICLTDMAKAKEGDNRAADVIKNWIRTRTTIELDNTEYTDPCFGHTDPPTGFNSKNSIN